MVVVVVVVVVMVVVVVVNNSSSSDGGGDGGSCSSTRKEGNGLFNNELNTSYSQLCGVGHDTVKNHLNRVSLHGLLFPISSK